MAQRAKLRSAAACLLLAQRALAQSAPVLDLHWAAPVGCPQQDALQARVQQLSGSGAGVDNHLSAEGTVTQASTGRFRLKLVVHQGVLNGERELESASCTDLAGAAAVTLGLLLRSAEPLPVEPEVVATPLAPPAPQLRRWHALAQAPLFVLGVGPLPKPSFGLALGGGIALGSWRFAVSVTDWLPQEVRPSSLEGYGATVELQTASWGVCRAFRVPPFEVAPCLDASLLHLSARGTGTHVTSRSRAATWFAPGAGAQARLSLSRWFSLAAAVNGEFELARPRIAIQGAGQIDQLGPAAATVMLGSEWIL